MTPPTSAGHASDEILALYAMRREDVDAASAAHIAHCPLCLHESVMFERLGHELDEQLYRVTCPSVETLVAYALQELSPMELAWRAVETHLQECKRCAEEVRATQVFLERTAPDLAAWTAPASSETQVAPEPGGAAAAPDPMGALRRILAQLLPHPAPLQPAFTVQGTTDEGGILQVFRAEDLTVTIQQEAVQGTYVVTGSIHQEQQNTTVPPSSVGLSARLVGLSETAGETGLRLVGESAITRGIFEFEGVVTGSYQIELLFPDRLVVLLPIAVGGTS